MTAPDWIALAKVIISWPILGGVFLWVFAPQIRTLLLGIRRVSTAGIEFEPKQQERTEEARRLSGAVATLTATPASTPVPGTPDPFQVLSQIADQVAALLDANMVTELTSRTAAALAAQQFSPDRAIPLLVRQVAVFSMAALLEYVYSSIWGSQLAILQFLAVAPGPVPVERVRPFYAAAAQQYPAAFETYPFDNYLNFLTTSGLVSRTGAMVTITPLGRELLAYIVRTGRTTQKIF